MNCRQERKSKLRLVLNYLKGGDLTEVPLAGANSITSSMQFDTSHLSVRALTIGLTGGHCSTKLRASESLARETLARKSLRVTAEHGKRAGRVRAADSIVLLGDRA